MVGAFLIGNRIPLFIANFDQEGNRLPVYTYHILHRLHGSRMNPNAIGSGLFRSAASFLSPYHNRSDDFYTIWDCYEASQKSVR